MADRIQVQKSYQKQHNIFRGYKDLRGPVKRAKFPTRRWWKNIGLGFQTPKEAIEGDYIDRKCPFTGLVAIRRRILQGRVKSAKMQRAIIVRREYLHFDKKYQRYEKRHTNIPAHLPPCFRVRTGDTVTLGQCRPLSKTIRFCVIRVDKSADTKRKGFTGF